jgi:acyl-CoA dehydrogenase
MLDFSFTEEQLAIRETIAKTVEKFDDAYWLARDRDGRFPHDYCKVLADGGWFGITMPEEYGGAGKGVIEAAIVMHTIGALGASATSAVHINLFGPQPVVVFGTHEQKTRMLPPLIRGEHRACFGVTEPDAGSNTPNITTFAERKGERYIVHGKKVWISTAQIANKILLVTRTTKREECARPTDGMTLFYTDLDRGKIEVREIEKMARKAVDSNELFIDGLEVPVEDRIGEEGKGFKYLLHGLNPERVLVAASAVGGGMKTLGRAVNYAKERVVFGRPIGMNQAIQHPLADCWMKLQAAELMMWKAASLYDAGKPCGVEATAAKYLAAEAAFETAQRAVRTHGGYGFSKEYHVERSYRESILAMIAPLSQELALCHVAEHGLGLPKSY